MKRYSFQQVDVFASAPYKGNPLAVVCEADGISDGQTKALGNWTNLSETTFC
jgi:PhzF family phenazine biosynthesis protein